MLSCSTQSFGRPVGTCRVPHPTRFFLPRVGLFVHGETISPVPPLKGLRSLCVLSPGLRPGLFSFGPTGLASWMIRTASQIGNRHWQPANK